MNDLKIFIERLVEMRSELGLSQGKLGELVGVSDACVSRWESGIRIPKADSIIALCKVLKCSADYLLGLSDEW